jgi:putative secretion ATPase (PEP-CTERM system associated)|tara:strand:- start:8969 stop:10012 length:1044 start_codon:yes stop_codon:yes gene_type:complete
LTSAAPLLNFAKGLYAMYEKYYGFRERPFQLTPTPNWFYASKLHKRALAYLQYGLSQGEGFIVITGDVGTGKTTIANQLLNQLNQDEIIAKQIVTSKLEPDDLIRMVASSFNLVVTEHTKASYLDAIYSYLKRLHAQHRRALLLVDEAQNLPLASIEELRMLSNFQFNGKPLLQSFLLGQNELNAIIQSPDMEQFRQRIIASSNLSALQPDDTKAYIQYRLQQAGADSSIIHEDCYPFIHQQSKGIPRKINTLMDRVLLYGYLEDKKQLNTDDVQLVIAEINQEVANLHPSAPMPPSSAADNTGISHNVSTALNSMIEEKLKLLQEMDELLKKQQKALQQKESKPFD